MKKKKNLIIDKKECSSCGSILEKDTKICSECGYDISTEENIKETYKRYLKFLNEQVSPPQNKPIVYDQGKKQFYTTNPVGGTNMINNPSMKGKTVTISADEGKKKNKDSKNNPWAICTASVGRDDKKKFERCVLDVKKKNKMDEDLKRISEYIERIITDSEIKPKIKKGDFKEFISKTKLK